MASHPEHILPDAARNFRAPQTNQEDDIEELDPTLILEAPDLDEGYETLSDEEVVLEDEDDEILDDADVIEEPETPEIVRLDRAFHTKVEGQKAELLLAHVSDKQRGAELSFGMKKGEKREQDERGEDALFYDPETGLGGVADGLGEDGKGHGAFASEFVSKHMKTFYREARSFYTERRPELSGAKITDKDLNELAKRQLETEGYLETHPQFQNKLQELYQEYRSYPSEVQKELIILENAVERAQTAIRKSGLEGKTTLSAGKTVLVGNERFEVFIQVGDGKVQLIDNDGKTEDLLPEHSALNVIRARGIDVDGPSPEIRLPNGKVFSKKDLARSMTTALGDPDKTSVRPFVGARKLEIGQSILYMTDGLADIEGAMEQTSETLSKQKKPESYATALLDLVAQNDNKRDDKAVLAKKITDIPTEQAFAKAA